jgi:ankyrin repeat protein
MDDPKDQHLQTAIENGDLEEVAQLCELYPYLLELHGAKYLSAVSRTGNMQMARILVRHGARPNSDAEDTARALCHHELADFLNRSWPGQQARG